MCPVSVGTSRSVRALETGDAKLWVLLVGVNQYEDGQFPRLAYPALDCQGLGEAIAAATQPFPQKSVVMHHDFARPTGSSEVPEIRSLAQQVAVTGRMALETVAKLRGFAAQRPCLSEVRASLEQIVANAQPQDTILFYFSGHGVLEPTTGQATLCLTDTRRDDLLQTGLGMPELLTWLGKCRAHNQLVWLDACHSGSLTFRAAKGEAEAAPLTNPTPQLMELLRQRAAQSKGFYALLSCDVDQQSWEFPELGHGVFTYFLMRGLLGEAADPQGLIEVDALYKYVYYQTLQYIDKTNQQLRLINQQKRGRGDRQLQQEYPLQTPKRIVEGIGELFLGIRPGQAEPQPLRRSLVVDGLGSSQASLSLSKLLRGSGGFELSYFPQSGKEWSGVREAIQSCLQSGRDAAPALEATTALLYLRGHVEQSESGDALLLLKDGVQISRSWLRHELRRSPLTQQIVILDCPGATTLADWVEDLQIDPARGQCLIAAAAPEDQPEQFTEVLLATLSESDAQTGLSAAGWIAQLQSVLAGTPITPSVWLSGSQGVIEVLPGRSARSGGSGLFDLGLCPYLGLRAFGEDDSPFFFGREQLTQRLLTVLTHQSFLAVVGASGSGKSSLVHAGLIAALRQGKQMPGSEDWWVRSLRPGDRPLTALAKRLVDGGTERERSYQQLQLEGMLYQGVEGLVHWLRSRPEPMVVLVVDQFEELFTLAAAADRQRFLELMLGAVEYAGDRFKLILTLRTDFISACLEVPALAQRLQQSSVLVPPSLTDEDYRKIILRPAEKVGLKVDPELVEVLLQELHHGAGDLPLLEFVLEQVWQHRLPGKLTLNIYQQRIGGLKGALERKAQTVYDSLDPEAQACARWIFLSLTQLGDGTEDTRRRVLKSDLIVAKFPESLVERTLQALTAAKLVVVSLEDEEMERPAAQHRGEADGLDAPACALPDLESTLQRLKQEVTVEVAHEILIRHWSTLRWWLEENRTRLRAQRQVQQAAQQWQQSDRQPDFLLRGVRLEAAEELYIQFTDELSREVQEFIEAGLQDRERQQQQTQQRLRRARMAIATISTLGLIAALAGGGAYWQQRQSQLNELRALNALSEAQGLGDRQLESLLTSIRAGTLLQQTLGVESGLRMQTLGTLRQAVETTAELNRLQGHSQRVTGVSVSPIGQIASGSEDGTVKLWQPDGTLMRTLAVQERVTGVAFSPDGQRLAAVGADGLRLWQVERETSIQSLGSGWMTGVSWSPDGTLLATAGRDRTITLWNATTGKPVRTLTGHTGWVNAVSFSPDGKLLASASEDRTLRLWNVADGRLMRTLTGHGDRVTTVTFTRDGKQVISGSDDRTLKRWNLSDGSAQTLTVQTGELQSQGDRITRISLSSNGQLLASGSGDGTIDLWNLDGTLLETLRGHGSDVLSVAFAPDGQTLVSAGVDKTVRIWQVPHATEILPTYAAALSPNGERVAAGGWDGTLHLRRWRAAADEKTLSGHSAPVNAIAFSARQLASGSDDQTVRIWDLNGQLQQTLKGHSAKVTAVAFSPDGSRLASASADRTVRLWNAADGSLLKTFTGHQDGVSSLVMNPHAGDSLFASGSYDQTAILWSADGTVRHTLKGHTSAIAAIAFSPRGDMVATGSWDNTIKLWRVQDGQLLRTLAAHQDGVTSLQFSPDGNTLVSGSADRTVRFWRVNDGQLLKTFLELPDAVRSVQFSPDGQALLVASEAIGTQVWDLNLAQLIRQGCDRLQNYLKTNPTIPESDRRICQQ